jgi:hypothetical protein
MKPSVSVYAFALWSLAASATAPAGDSAGKLLRPDPERLPDVHLWTDTSNVGVLRDGEAARLVTHHHREGIQGLQRLAGTGARIGGPAAEPDLLERPGEFRKARPSLVDRCGRWARELRDAFREIRPGGGHPYGFDPFWVRAEPFHLRVKAGGAGGRGVRVRAVLPSRRGRRVLLLTRTPKRRTMLLSTKSSRRRPQPWRGRDHAAVRGLRER